MNNSAPFSLLPGIGVAAILTVCLVAFLILLAPMIFYLLTLQKALGRCAPENRAMEPGLVWLMLIPCVGLVWHFFIVLNMAKSLGKEFQKRGITAEPEPGKVLGLVMCILCCCSWIPFLGILCSLGALVCWIIYWVQIAGFSRQLQA
jgi:hypothetical protein